MPPLLIPVLIVELVYAFACVTVGARPGAPLWLGWPTVAWDYIRWGRRPAPVRPRPDYAKIARLERELGID